MNYVTWTQAREFALWAGERTDLPTEAQWEFAARSRGQEILYPWGNAAPNCEYADWGESDDNIGCNGAGTSPVCTHPTGHSAEGLCNLAANLGEWLLDEYSSNYNGAPVDGSAWCALEDCAGDRPRSVRGGVWHLGEASMHTRRRNYAPFAHYGHGTGLRPVKLEPIR